MSRTPLTLRIASLTLSWLGAAVQGDCGQLRPSGKMTGFCTYRCTCLLPGVTSGCHYALLLLPQPPGSVPAPLEGWREGQGSWRSEQHPSSAPGTLVPANFLQNCPDQEISCLPGSLPAQDEWALGVPQGRLPTTSWTVGGAEVHLALSPPRPS